MKITIGTAFLMLSLSAFTQNTCLKDSVYSYNSNAAITSGTPTRIDICTNYNAFHSLTESISLSSARDTLYREQNTYNVNNKKTNYLYQDYVGNAFVNSYTEQYTFQNDILLTQEKYSSTYDAGSNSWVYDFEKLYTYADPNFPNLPTIIEQKNLDASGNQTGGNKTINTYNSNGKLSVSIYQTWNSSNSTYVNNSKNVYTYNSSQLNDTMYRFLEYNGGWSPISYLAKAYNTTGKIIESNFYFNQSGNGLVPQNRTYYYYNNQNNTDSIYYQDYNGTNYVTQNIEYYNQNAAGLDTLFWGKNLTNGNMINSFQQIRRYNADNYLVKSINTNWDANTSTWVPSSMGDYYYNCFSTTGLTTNIINALNIYPNPFSASFYVSSNSFGIAHIYDFQGKSIADFQIHSGINTLNTENIPAGIYFLQFEGNSY